MQVATLEQHEALAKEVEQLREMLQQFLNSPLALEWVTMDQAKVMLGKKTYQTVSRMCKDGKLEYKQDGRTIHVKLDSIRKYNQSKTIN